MSKSDPNISYETSAKNQYLITLVVNILAFVFGTACGWSSPNIELLQSDDSPLESSKISKDEGSWIVSLMCIGSLIGNFSFAIITDKLIAMAIPNILGWVLIWYAQNVYYLYIGRLLNGFVGGGMYVIVPQYLQEISNDRVRGLLGSTLVFSCNTGILVEFIFGNYLDFYAPPKLVIVLTVVFATSLFFFPESPSYLIKQNRISETENSIRFYQNIRRNTQDYRLLQMEINKLQSSIGDAKTTETSSWSWSDLTTNPGKKAMTIGIVLAALNQFCGCFAMLNYTATIFKEAGSTMSPNMSAIFVGVIQIFGSFAATFLVDILGRKFLFAASTIGTALGLTTLGTYMMLKSLDYDVETYNVIPLVGFSVAICMAAWAILTLPFLVISEILPDNLKNFGTSVCMTILWSSQFFMLKCLPLIMDLFGFHGSMFLFAGICIARTNNAIFAIEM